MKNYPMNTKSNMKKFNLQLAKEGATICLRSGTPATILKFDGDPGEYNTPLHVQWGNDRSHVYGYTEDGIFEYSKAKSGYDLMIINYDKRINNGESKK